MRLHPPKGERKRMIRENLSLSCARTCTKANKSGAENMFHGFDRTNNGLAALLGFLSKSPAFYSSFSGTYYELLTHTEHESNNKSKIISICHNEKNVIYHSSHRRGLDERKKSKEWGTSAWSTYITSSSSAERKFRARKINNSPLMFFTCYYYCGVVVIVIERLWSPSFWWAFYTKQS